MIVLSVDWTQLRLRELEDRSTETSILKREVKKYKKSNRIFRSCEIVTKCSMCIEKTQEETEEIFELVVADIIFNFLPNI